jgi:preprotein translocase subunit SecD
MITVAAVIFLTPSIAEWLGKEQKLPEIWTKHVKNRIQLGLDLQGGLHLVYEVQVDKAVSDKADRLSSDIEEKLRKAKGIKDVRADRNGRDEIVMTFKNPAEAAKMDREFLREFRRYLYEESRDAAKGVVKLRMDSEAINELRDYAIRQSKETIENRANRLGVAEPNVFPKGNDIIVEFPGLKPERFEYVKNQIGRTAQLEFKMVDDGAEYMKKVAAAAAAKKTDFPGIEIAEDGWNERESGRQHGDVYLRSKDRVELERFVATALVGDQAIPSDHEIGYEEMRNRGDDENTTAKEGEKFWRTYYLHRRAELTGEYLTDAEVSWNSQTGTPEVSVSFDHQGAALFEKASGSNIGRKMAIILDEKINSAPVIESRIGGGHAVITMGGAGDVFQRQEEAKTLVAVLKGGALPAPLKKTFETQVGPTLGRDAVDKAKFSMMIGSFAVIIFMLIYYRVSGLIANIAMILNVLYQLAFLSILPGGGTLTLPGIAGVVLTVGMAVDANIIIYERIREELRAGKSARGAVEAGFGRAFWTVFDAHVTNAVAGFVLLSFGTGPIRGFAVTLLIGIGANLFTSVWVSRAMFDFYVGRKAGGAQTLSI